MLEITIRGPIASGKSTVQEEAISRLRKIGVSAFNGDLLRTPKAAQTLNADILIKTEMTGADLHWAFTQSKPTDNAVLRIAARTIVAESIDHVLKKFADAQPKPAPAPEAACPGYLVWNPAHGQPRVRHADMTAAVTEAMRLADQYPENRFYVMAPVQEFIIHEIRTKSPIQISAVGQTYEPELTETQKLWARIPREMHDDAAKLFDRILTAKPYFDHVLHDNAHLLRTLEQANLIAVKTSPSHHGKLEARLTSEGRRIAVLAALVDEIPF